MIVFDEKTAAALEYVRNAEKLMTELGHTKYSLSGMCSAAMRHDLEKEVGELLGELSEARKEIENLNVTITAALNSSNACHFRAIEYQSQRDTLVDALKEIYNVSLFDWETMPDESKNKYREIVLEMTDNSLAAVKGGTMSNTPRTDKAANESISAVYEESKKLERELAAANQIMGELCESCGWAMRFPDQPCRCELEAALAAVKGGNNE
jgi:ketopantoate reductase